MVESSETRAMPESSKTAFLLLFIGTRLVTHALSCVHSASRNARILLNPPAPSLPGGSIKPPGRLHQASREANPSLPARRRT